LIITFVQAVAVVQAIAPPAPPSPPRPPALYPGVIVSSAGLERVRFPVDLIVRGPEGPLWQGRVWVSNAGPTNLRQSRSEPGDPACLAAGSSSFGTQRVNEVNVDLNQFNSPADPARANVTVRWIRPAGQGCAELGSRTVELRQSVSLPAGQTVTLNGDGGLVVELRRR
jgi:hypothetical protein